MKIYFLKVYNIFWRKKSDSVVEYVPLQMYPYSFGRYIREPGTSARRSHSWQASLLKKVWPYLNVYRYSIGVFFVIFFAFVKSLFSLSYTHAYERNPPLIKSWCWRTQTDTARSIEWCGTYMATVMILSKYFKFELMVSPMYSTSFYFPHFLFCFPQPQ